MQILGQSVLGCCQGVQVAALCCFGGFQVVSKVFQIVARVFRRMLVCVQLFLHVLYCCQGVKMVAKMFNVVLGCFRLLLWCYGGCWDVLWFFRLLLGCLSGCQDVLWSCLSVLSGCQGFCFFFFCVWLIEVVTRVFRQLLGLPAKVFQVIASVQVVAMVF